MILIFREGEREREIQLTQSLLACKHNTYAVGTIFPILLIKKLSSTKLSDRLRINYPDIDLSNCKFRALPTILPIV